MMVGYYLAERGNLKESTFRFPPSHLHLYGFQFKTARHEVKKKLVFPWVNKQRSAALNWNRYYITLQRIDTYQSPLSESIRS
jgi:hypothetical protein